MRLHVSGHGKRERGQIAGIAPSDLLSHVLLAPLTHQLLCPHRRGAGRLSFRNRGRTLPVRPYHSCLALLVPVREHVFRNPRVWTIAVADFFVYTVRFAALDWGIVLLMETKGLSLAQATTLCFVFEIIGGNCGMVVAGWVTDRFFGSRSHRTSVFCLLGAALAILAFWAVPASAPLAVKLVPFLFIGFFIYGPQALLGIATTQQATPRAAGVAGGFVGIFSYASTVLSGVGFGYVAQCWGWNAAYATICCAAVFGGLALLAMWRADAYAGR